MLHSQDSINTAQGYTGPKQAIPSRPLDALPIVENLPPDLLSGDRFLNWLWTWKPPTATAPGEWTKPPHSATSGWKTDATNPANGVGFRDALAAAARNKMSGVGRQLFEEDGFIAWDFDDCYDPETQTITDPDVAAFVREFNSFTEVTPSRTGLRVWGKGTAATNKGKKREVYSGGRYMTLTGCHLAGTPRTVNDIQAATDRLIPRIFPPKPSFKQQPAAAFQHETAPLSADDETVRRRARLSQKFRDTESGDDRHYDGDASDADQGYTDSLVGAGADSPEQVIRIWQAGRRWRPKCDDVHYADGKTYAEGTAAKAFDGYVQNRYARNEPILVVHQPPPAPVASESDDVAYWRKRAETAEALVAGLQTMIETLALENAELRQENSTIINVTTNPSLKSEAPTVIRTVIDIQEAKRRGDVDEDGYVRISTSKIGDDYGDDRFDGLDGSIRSRSTVNRHLKKMADLGMIEREVRTVMAPRILRDKDKKPVIDPETNRPKTYEASTDQTWVKLTGESITDALRPFALFRAPETMPGEPPKVKRHGGDRRSADFKANRTPCPDCGGTDRVVWCVGCGSDITAVAEADEKAAHAADPPAFQDAPYIKRGAVPTFQDETGGAPTSTPRLTLVASGRSNPPPTSSPPIDWGVPF